MIALKIFRWSPPLCTVFFSVKWMKRFNRTSVSCSLLSSFSLPHAWKLHSYNITLGILLHCKALLSWTPRHRSWYFTYGEIQVLRKIIFHHDSIKKRLDHCSNTSSKLLASLRLHHMNEKDTYNCKTFLFSAHPLMQ